MPIQYRFAGPAEDQIDRILLESAREWGVEAAARYHRLILATMSAVGDDPTRPGARAVSRITGLRVFPLRLGRRLVQPEHRVKHPRHAIVYRVAPDGMVEIQAWFTTAWRSRGRPAGCVAREAPETVLKRAGPCGLV